MIKNYLLIVLRNIRRNPVFATINIFGFAIGLACCIFIFFYVNNELGYDRFHSASDRIYRVTNEFERTSGTLKSAMTPPTLTPIFRDDFPEIEKVCRMRYSGGNYFTIDDQTFYGDNIFFADSVFLLLFDFPILRGSRSALDQPNSVVLTRQGAIKYFGTEEAVGRTMQLDGDRTLAVTAVVEGMPQSHLDFDMLISFNTFTVPVGYPYDLSSWRWVGFLTYVQLREDASVTSLENKIVKYYQDNLEKVANLKASIYLQPLTDIYFGSSEMRKPGSIRSGNMTTVQSLSLAALLILVIAGFNFMNLSTAMSFMRSKEIGIRKVMGALKSRVTIQFLFESVVISILSLTIALGLVFLSKSYFADRLDIQFPVALEAIASYLPLFLAATIVIGLLSGLYPSLVLSSYTPINALKGTQMPAGRGATIRKTLMVFQFAISVSLIAASVILVQQMSFMKNKSLGFDKENILEVESNGEVMSRHYQTLKNAFKENSQVIDVAKSSSPLHTSVNSAPVRLKGAPESEIKQIPYLQVDHDFLKVMNVQLLEGRFFQRHFKTDSIQTILLNETAVAEFGLKDAIGKRIIFNNGQEREVIGVFNDFHYNSMHSAITPLAMIIPFSQPQIMYVKLNPGEVAGTLEALQSDWDQIVNNFPFDYSFLDDNIEQQYAREDKLTALINLFSALAVILACLGLYGLVAFTVNNRLKEVGIRKVLGASVSGLLGLLSKQFLILILLSNAIAWPVTLYFAKEWLNEFAYRIEIGPVPFLISAILLLAIAMLTISHLTLRAALTNPVTVLRNE